MFEFLEVLSAGCGASWQDEGRPGWKRFGVPPGGWMDPAAAREANRLAGNESSAVVIELVLPGAVFRARRAGWLAVAGADLGWPPGTARQVSEGEELRFASHGHGVYAYLAAPGGWEAPRLLGSASVSARCGLGRMLQAGEVLSCAEDPRRPGWQGVAGRRRPAERYASALEVTAWRGPQWRDFSPEAQQDFCGTAWRVSARSDRMGVRLEGPPVTAPERIMISEPVLPGSVQITGAGQPVVTMRDGPTVGGYPKMICLDDEEVRRVAQVPPGGTVKFRVRNE